MRNGPHFQVVRGAALALLCSVAILSAQDFTLDWSAASAGGGQSTGGDFALDATIGQPDPGTMTGGDFELSGGFWSIITTLDTPGAPALALAITSSGVVISWPASTDTGFVLEQADTLVIPPVAGTWSTVNQTPQQTNGLYVVQLPLTSANRFFRLHKP
jgi:hypothetical protein